MRYRRSALLEAGLGVLACALALAALGATASAVQPAGAPPALDTLPLAQNGGQTPAPAAPTPIGPAYDDDRALPAQAAPIASYRLTAKLDAQSHQIAGKGVIAWRNASSAPVRELWLHLYLNAFKNDRTLFLRSPFGAGRSAARARRYGYVDVKKLVARELGGKDLWPRADKHSPRDPDDQTDIRVPLPAPVAPGEQLTLEIEFTSQLPQIIERTGYSGSFHMVAQWFPKLAKLEPDGTWVHFPFHSQSEFYADYGNYAIDIDVPESMVVGATGRRVSELRESGRRVLQYEADSVHDFAWTAWDGYQEQTRPIRGVDVRILYPAGLDSIAETTLKTVDFGLAHFGARYGQYPYPTLTIAHPPDYAPNAGGMEYPTFITTGGAWYLPIVGTRAIEAVTLHELAHQWFYGLVATNEHAWPFLDEGLTSYAEGLALEARFGPGSLFELGGMSLSYSAVYRNFAAARAQEDPVASPAARFHNFSVLGALVYSRTATILRTLGNVYGHPALNQALSRYARRYRYQHPTPRHFVAAVRESLGPEAAEALHAALFERATIDFAARDLASVRARTPAGVFDRGSGRETVVSDQGAAQSGEWIGQVTVHRFGSLRLPVEIDLVLADGTRQRRRWDGRGTRTVLDYRGPSRLIGAVVDPEQRLLLDDNLLNNAVTRGVATAPYVLERATYWAELALALFGP